MQLDLTMFFQACNPSKTLAVGKAEDRQYYIDFYSVHGKTIAFVSGDKSIKLWRRQGFKLQSSDINELLKQGCNWLRDYLKTNPNVTKSARRLCNI